MHFYGKHSAPTSRDRECQLVRAAYTDRSIQRAIEEKRLVPNDADLISEFITEVRTNKLICLLVNWRRFLPPFRDCTIAQVFRSIPTIKTATSQ